MAGRAVVSGDVGESPQVKISNLSLRLQRIEQIHRRVRGCTIYRSKGNVTGQWTLFSANVILNRGTALCTVSLECWCFPATFTGRYLAIDHGSRMMVCVFSFQYTETSTSVKHCELSQKLSRATRSHGYNRIGNAGGLISHSFDNGLKNVDGVNFWETWTGFKVL